MSNIRIDGVQIVHALDTDPDLSYLGEYSDEPAAQFSIDRKEQGDLRGRTFTNSEYRYFNAANVDNDAHALENYRRMEAYNNQQWGMIGIFARAHVSVSHDGGKTWTMQTIRTAGLWGIEDDMSDDGYFREIAQEQVDELRDHLKAFGFLSENIDPKISEALTNDPVKE